MKQLLFACAILTCSFSGPGQKALISSARQQNLALELKNDRYQLDRDRFQRERALAQGKNWKSDTLELHYAIEQSDLIRMRIDEELTTTCPALPRTQLDQLADQLDSRLRSAKSFHEAQQSLTSLTDLNNYIFSLDKSAESKQSLFSRNIAARASLIQSRM